MWFVGKDFALDSKAILVIGGGLEAVEGIRQLKESGFFTIVCDGDENAPCFALADATIVSSIYHAEECVPAVAKYHQGQRKIDGLIVLACDAPHVGARVAKEIGVPGLSVDVADRMVDKLQMKLWLQKGGVRVPDFAQVYNYEEVKDHLSKWKKIVVKPTDSRGSKGVTILDETGDAAWAFQYARSFSPSGHVMVERFISGLQLSTESLVVEGKAYTIGFADRNYEYLDRFAPFVIENGGDLPSKLARDSIDNICTILDQAARSVEIENGPLKGDLVIDDTGTVYIIELAARLSGGHFCTFDIPFSTGVELVTLAAKLATGFDVSEEDLAPKYQKNISIRLLFPDIEGEIISVSGVEEASASEGVLKVLVWAKKGMQSRLPTNSGGSLGVVIASGEDRHLAQQNALNGLGKIHLEVH